MLSKEVTNPSSDVIFNCGSGYTPVAVQPTANCGSSTSTWEISKLVGLSVNKE